MTKFFAKPSDNSLDSVMVKSEFKQRNDNYEAKNKKVYWSVRESKNFADVKVRRKGKEGIGLIKNNFCGSKWAVSIGAH